MDWWRSGRGCVYVLKNGIHPETGVEVFSRFVEWVAAGVSPQIGNRDLQNVSYHPELSELHRSLVNGQPFRRLVDEVLVPFRSSLESQEIKSLAVFPLVISGQFRGFIGFDYCRERRVWSPQTHQMLEAASSAIGSTLNQWEVDAALLAANAELQKPDRGTPPAPADHDQPHGGARSQAIARNSLADFVAGIEKFAVT